jgi:uncharacterized protein (DUF2141 family)
VVELPSGPSAPRSDEPGDDVVHVTADLRLRGPVADAGEHGDEIEARDLPDQTRGHAGRVVDVEQAPALRVREVAGQRAFDPPGAGLPELPTQLRELTVDGFRNTTGQARVAVFKQPQGFPDGESDAFRRTVAAIEGGRVQVRFDDLSYGDYAVSMYHDENGDQKLNKKIFGIPTEGYGVSNNVVHGMRSPKFAEAKFVLAEVEREIQIHVHY